jgi:hypothetical protein
MKELTNKEIQYFLKQHMKSNGYSIVEMSKMIGVNYQSIMKFLKKDNIYCLSNKNKKKYIEFYNKVNNIESKPVEEEIQKKLSPKFEIISLETYEEINEALKKGETIYKGNTSYFVDNDFGNMLVKKVNDKVVALNPCINIDEVYYVKRRKKINVSVGKCYKDSTGSVWFCCSNASNKFFCVHAGSSTVFPFTEDGLCLESSVKLIEEC